MNFDVWKEVNKIWSKEYSWDFDRQLEETWKEAQKEYQDMIKSLRSENEHLKDFIAKAEQKLNKINYNYLSDAQCEIEQLSNLCKGKSI